MDSAQVKAFFDEVSADWDNMRTSFYHEEVIDALATSTRIDATTCVLDVGTGTGFVAAGMGPIADHVVGIDNSAPMLAVAGHNLASLSVGNVTLVRGELDNFPLPEASVDAAVANMVLHHAPRPAWMLQEMARVTRPGGWIAITDAVSHDHEWMRTEQADLWLGFSEAEAAGFFAEARLVDYGYASLGMQ